MVPIIAMHCRMYFEYANLISSFVFINLFLAKNNKSDLAENHGRSVWLEEALKRVEIGISPAICGRAAACTFISSGLPIVDFIDIFIMGSVWWKAWRGWVLRLWRCIFEYICTMLSDHLYFGILPCLEIDLMNRVPAYKPKYSARHMLKLDTRSDLSAQPRTLQCKVPNFKILKA